MKLAPLEKLMATLATETTDSQLDQLLSNPDFTVCERDNITCAVDMLVSLKRKAQSNSQFLNKLKQLMEDMDHFQNLAILVRNFCEKYTDVNALEWISRPTIPHGAFQHTPSPQQKTEFKRVMQRMSQMIDKRHLKIITALTPLPEGLKESLTGGLKLFEALQRHGCISENDVELLDEFFVHMRLIAPQQALQSYKNKYPPRHYDPRPSAPLRYPSDPGPSPRAHQHHPTSPFQSQQSYPPPSYPPPSHLPPSPFPTGFPSGAHTYPSHPEQGGPGQQCQQPPSVLLRTTTQSLYRRPGYRDPTFPRQRDPLIVARPEASIHPPSEHSIYANLPPANQAAAAPPTTLAEQPTVSERRGGREDEQFESASSAEQQCRPLPENPNFPSPPRVFNKQVSSSPSLGTAVNIPHSPPTPREPAVTTPSSANEHHPLHNPSLNPPPSQPSSNLPSLGATINASAASSSSSASYEHVSNPSVFLEPQSCQSTGDPSRSSVSLPLQYKPADSGLRSPPTTSVGYAREPHSLPSATGDKLLGKRSRQMRDVSPPNPTSKVTHAPSSLAETGEKGRVVLRNRSASLGVVPQQQRQVFHKHEVGGAGGNMPSLNIDVQQQCRSSNIQPGTITTQPGSSSTQPRPSSSHPSSQQYSSRSAATQPEEPGSNSYHPVVNQSPPIPVYGSSSNNSFEVVSGMSASPPAAPRGAGSRGGSYQLLPNPHNSQYVMSQNNSSIGYSSHGSSVASSFGSANSSHGAYSHDPSTSSLVNRQLFPHQPNAMPSSQGASSSFAPISEEDESEDQRESENNRESYDSSESEPPSMAPRRKRSRANGAREEEEAAARPETSSSSEQENGEAEEPRNTKRARTEVHKQKKPGIFTRTLQSLPLIGRLYKTEPKEETSASDSDSDHFEDAHD